MPRHPEPHPMASLVCIPCNLELVNIDPENVVDSSLLAMGKVMQDHIERRHPKPKTDYCKICGNEIRKGHEQEDHITLVHLDWEDSATDTMAMMSNLYKDVKYRDRG